MMEAPYPIILNLAKKNVTVIGGGEVAHREIRKLFLAGIVSTVISPELAADIDQAKINWTQDIYRRKHAEEMDIIITCTNDVQVNDRAKTKATRFQLVNNASDKTNPDFYDLATFSSDDMFISVLTMGKSPSVIKKMKNEVKEWVSKRFHKEFE